MKLSDHTFTSDAPRFSIDHPLFEDLDPFFDGPDFGRCGFAAALPGSAPSPFRSRPSRAAAANARKG